MQHSLQVQGLTKIFRSGGGETHALRGIDLELPRGSLTMLVGPSGCGKTTLLSVIAGILNHDAGSLKVLDQDLDRMDEAGRTLFRRRRIGFVFQAFNLIPALDAAENVSIPAILNGLDRKTAIARADELLDRVGLADQRRKSPRDMSGGQQQRVAIARALIHQPDLIVCDEPTSALDHKTGEQVMEILRDLALRDGRSLIIVTHDARILHHADITATLSDGRVEGILTGTRLGHS
ncbi:MAG: hypothetical protein RL095_3581 [Verrucomicrobiota bacterium]|jgi:putative ABC transport system ATP-binding protein